MKNKSLEIKSRKNTYTTADIYKDRQSRLKVLVEKHGVNHVSEATGMTVGTIAQYCRVATPVAMSENTIQKAEIILKGL